MNILLRGHERGVLSDNTLLENLKLIDYNNLYIQTWRYTEATSSWRNNLKEKREIGEGEFREYFPRIAAISVLNEDDLFILGKKVGLIGTMPRLAYKRTWAGVKEGLKLVDPNDSLLVMRMDFFQVDKINYTENFDYSVEQINKLTKKENKLNFLCEKPEIGIDNAFFGCYNTIVSHVDNMYYNQDSYEKLRGWKPNHEKMFYLSYEKGLHN